MNLILLAASLLTVLIGVVHSLLGEKLVFSKLRPDGVVPTDAPFPLEERNIRIIWATWHVVSLFGFGIAFLLYWLASPSTEVEVAIALRLAIAVPMLLSGLLVLWATRAKHPGWAGLLLVGTLVLASS